MLDFVCLDRLSDEIRRQKLVQRRLCDSLLLHRRRLGLPILLRRRPSEVQILEALPEGTGVSLRSDGNAGPIALPRYRLLAVWLWWCSVLRGSCSASLRTA